MASATGTNESESGARSRGAGTGGAGDSIVTEFATYEDFLDSQITQTDLYYLEVRCTLFYVVHLIPAFKVLTELR